MLRFDDCVCGTTTTGTGTLTLAAPPNPPGGIDPDAWARATGIGMGNSAAFLVDYTIEEWTAAPYSSGAKIKQKENGTGTLTLGSSSGIANCTLARTTIAMTATAIDTQPAVPLVKPGTGITIGTAANVLIMVAPRVGSVPGLHEYFENTLGDANWGITPEGFVGTGGSASANWPTSSTDWHIPVRVAAAILVKRLTLRCHTFTSVTGTPVFFARLYGFTTGGRPGKLLYDFTPSSGVTITATGNFATGAAGNGFLLIPGDYFVNLALTGLTGGTLNLRAPTGGAPNPAVSRMSTSSAIPNGYATATSATAGAGPDPANTTSYALVSMSTALPPTIGLSPA